MTEPSVEAADRILKRHRIRYAVVGGQAVARTAATATRDVDVMVTTATYQEAIAQLRDDPALTTAFEAGPVTRFGIRDLRGVPLDVIDAGVFAGTRTGAEFFDFLLGEQSTEVDGILYVSPEAVWYTRLLTKRWRAYAEKIVTNVVDGLEANLLEKVEAIGVRFGTEATLRERIAYVREELKRPELDALQRRE